MSFGSEGPGAAASHTRAGAVSLRPRRGML